MSWRATRLAVLGLAASIVLTSAATVQAAPTADSTCYNYSGGERKLARRINRSRSRHDLRKYSLDPELSRAATVHSKVMARRNTVFHTNDLGSKITRWSLLGEAVALGRTIKGIHKRLMASPVHRVLLLHGSFEDFGVGIKRKKGRRWTTIIFSAGRDPGTTFKMPDC